VKIKVQLLSTTEAVTRVADSRVPDTLYEEISQHFSEREIANLTFAIATINAWNRLAISARTTP
jgi:alkylhydroperoxidase family enzyme